MVTKIGRLVTIAVIILLTLIVVSIYKHPPQEPKEVIVRDTIITHDTITVEKPIPVYIHTRDTMYIHTTDTSNNDVVVALPREEKVYEDSTFRAVVSGYRPSLDAMQVYQRHSVVKVTEREAPPRWSLGLQGGVGVTPKGVQPYLGVGIAYRLNIK